MNDIRPFSPQDAVTIARGQYPIDRLIQGAALNQVAGTGFTLFENDKPVISAGIRVLGVGEAWFFISEDVRERLSNPASGDELKVLLDDMKRKIDGMVREYSLYQVWALCERNPKFLKALGFKDANAVSMAIGE